MTKITKKVICYYCNKPVTSNDNLVTAFYFLFVKPYHSACYSNRLKSPATFFVRNYPVNGFSGTFTAVGASVIGLAAAVLLIVMSAKTNTPIWQIALFTFIILIVSSLSLAVRLYSYYKYEKPLRVSDG